LLHFANPPSTLFDNRTLFGEIYPGDATSLGHPERNIAYRWVRHRDWKLIVPHSQNPKKAPWGGYLKSVALYDLKNDPMETTNLADLEPHEERVKTLRILLDEWWNPVK